MTKQSIVENTVAKKIRYMSDAVAYWMDDPDRDNLRKIELEVGDHIHVKSEIDGLYQFYISEITEDGFKLIERWGDTQTEFLTHEEMIEGMWNVTITWTDTTSWQRGRF